MGAGTGKSSTHPVNADAPGRTLARGGIISRISHPRSTGLVLPAEAVVEPPEHGLELGAPVVGVVVLAAVGMFEEEAVFGDVVVCTGGDAPPEADAVLSPTRAPVLSAY